MGNEEKNYYTLSNIPLKKVYTQEDTAHLDYNRKIGDPGNLLLRGGLTQICIG